MSCSLADGYQTRTALGIEGDRPGGLPAGGKASDAGDIAARTNGITEHDEIGLCWHGGKDRGSQLVIGQVSLAAMPAGNRGAGCCGDDAAGHVSSGTTRRILPETVRANRATVCHCTGRAALGSRSRTQSCNWLIWAVPSTQATTRWPNTPSGCPSTKHASTSGCWLMTISTSLGTTVAPAVRIAPSTRPRNVSVPSLWLLTRSPTVAHWMPSTMVRRSEPPSTSKAI